MGNFLKNLHPLLRRKKNEYDNKDPNYAIIDMFSEELNSIERDALDSRIQSSLNTATGKYLDIYGDWYGLYRKDDEKDETYRDRILEYVLLKRGTNNSIIDAIRRFLEDEEIYVNVYEPFQNIFYTNKSHLNGEDHLMGDYYRFAIIDITIGKRFPLEIIEEINKFKPAGVKVFFTYDSSYETSEDKIITNVFPKRYPKVTTYQNVDIFRGYGRLLYGHLNLGMAKVNKISDVFKTNNSLINSLDVLSGSATVGREYYNFTYKTKDSYIPKPNDFVTSISVENRNVEGEELNKDFYTDTNTRNNLSPETTIKPSEDRTSIYFNFDINEYLRRNGINTVTLELDNKELREYVSNYFGEVTLDFDMKAMVSPTNKVNVSLSIYDFVSKVWVKISSENLDLNSKNIGNKLGNLLDYINNNLALFLRLNIEPVGQETNIQISYIDLFFNRYDKDIYTIKPFKGIVESFQETDYLAETDIIKDTSLKNGDIITKSGYQPMQYLKLTDRYDNNINRNLIFNSQDIDSRIVTYQGATKTIEKSSNGYTRVRLTGGDSVVKALYTLNEIIKYKGEDISISFKLKTKNPLWILLNGFNSQVGSNFYYNENEIVYFKVEESYYVGGTPQLQFRPNGSEDLDFEIKDVKIEFGNKATPYQPNPEDIYGDTDPNQYVDIITKDIEGNIKPSKTVLLHETKPGINLLSNKDIITNTSKGSYVQGDTKELTMSLWGTKITQDGAMEEKLEEGKTYTISYDMEILEISDLPDYRHTPGIIVYTRNPTNVIAETRYVNGYEKVRDLPVGSKERVEFTFTMPYVDNVELIAYTGIFNETGEASPYETREYSTVKFSNIKLEEGSTATPYSTSPEATVSFLDKTIRFTGAYNDIQSIGLRTATDLNNVNLQYGIYGNDFLSMKKFTTLPVGETHVENDIIDLFGVRNLTYQNLNPFSEAIIRPFMDYTITKLMEDIGNVVDIPKGFFNATWQEIDSYAEHHNPIPQVIQDVVDGVIDNSSGKVGKVPTPQVITYTDVSAYTYKPAEYEIELTLDSGETIEKLKDVTLDTKTRKISTIPQVTTETTTRDLFISDSYKEKKVTQSQFAEYPLVKPIETGKRYRVIVEGDFKDNLEFISVYNSNSNFRETFMYPEQVINGVGTKEFIARTETNYKPRPNEDIRLYIRPYDDKESTVYSLDIIEL